MSEPIHPYGITPAPGTEPAGFDRAAPSLLRAERLAEIAATLAEYISGEEVMAGRPLPPSPTADDFVFPYTRDVLPLLAHIAALTARLADEQRATAAQERHLLRRDEELRELRGKLTAYQNLNRIGVDLRAAGETNAAEKREHDELARLKDAIRKASAQQMRKDEREAYASNTNGQGPRGAFGAGQLMGRALLAQTLLNLFDL